MTDKCHAGPPRIIRGREQVQKQDQRGDCEQSEKISHRNRH